MWVGGAGNSSSSSLQQCVRGVAVAAAKAYGVTQMVALRWGLAAEVAAVVAAAVVQRVDSSLPALVADVATELVVVVVVEG